MAIIDYVKKLDFVDTDNLFLLGESQGGCVSAITAPERIDDIKAMVLYYPALCIVDMAHERFKSREEITEKSDAFKLEISGKYYADVYDLDIYKEISAYDRPVLIMHGDKDVTVPHEYGKKAGEVYPNAVFETFEGEIHGWSGRGKVKAFRRSLEFLNSRL